MEFSAIRGCWLAALLLIGCHGATPAGEEPDAAGYTADALVSAPDAAVELGPEYLFDDDALRTYELTVADTDWEWLNDNARLEEYVPATLQFEGREYGPIGVRYKGGFGTLDGCFDDAGQRLCAKLSVKLKFNLYDPEGRFFGVKKLNFHSMIADPSELHDRLAYSLYREMGVAAPRAVHARLIVNGKLLGLFALVEQIDGRFTRSRFADGGEGNLYKEVWPIHGTAEPYLAALETNEDENPDVGKMIRFAQALADAGPDTVESVLESWTDLDALMGYLAVDRAIENWDGIVGFWCTAGYFGNHNFYWYEETGADRVWLIPWDLDNTFQVPNQFVTYYDVPAWDEVPQSCDCVPITEIGGIQVGRRPAQCDFVIRSLGQTLRDRYLAATTALLAGPFDLDAMNAKLDKWEEQIAPAVIEDKNGPMPSRWRASVDGLRADLATLRGQLEAVVAE